MDVQETGLTLEGLAHRLEALERENAELRQEVSALRASGKRRGEVQALRGPDPRREIEARSSESDEQVSRRWLLTKAGAAAVGAVAAGALMLRDTREAEATHRNDDLSVDGIICHFLSADSFITGVGTRESSVVTGTNRGSGPGVGGRSETAAVEGIATGLSGTGVEGKSEGSNGTGVKGTGRYGVWGESNQAGFYGVTGRNTNTDGTGVRGVGAERGVIGEATNGTGVVGRGKNGVYGESSSPNFGAVVGRNNSGDGKGVYGEANNGIGVQGVGKNGVYGESSSSGFGAVVGRNTAGDGKGLYGEATQGIGVEGQGKNGVYGMSSTPGFGAVVGRNTAAGIGAYGESNTGTGVQGVGANGVHGQAGTAGYAGLFQGGKSQLRLAPKGTAGKPTSGSHLKGEIYMDSNGSLFVCTADGTPGTWKKVNMKLV